MDLRTIRRASLGVALSHLLVPLHASAQTPTKLEPVVVTAARDAQPITDVLADITVIGPDGSPLTLADLPPPNTKRWVIRRKAEVVVAVRGGLLSLEDACRRYTLTVEEFLAWQRAIERFGLPGLRATRVQQYRH